MSVGGPPERQPQHHGNIFSRDSGAMLVHVQRESGLAHRTLTLSAWQVQALRVLLSRWFFALLLGGFASWVFFAAQAVRVPLLTRRLSRMEDDARRLDTLQQALSQMQQRYDQVQRMLSVPGPGTGTTPVTGAAREHPSAPLERSVRTTKQDSTRPQKGDSSARRHVP